jgi:hypothetical protein
MSAHGLSGTSELGRSGTASSDHREPILPASSCDRLNFEPRNHANKESFGFLLTPRSLWTVGKLSQRGPDTRMPSDAPVLTHVALVWREGQHEDWLRFGKPVAERIVDRARRIESYRPGQVFALVRWTSNGYGTARSTLHIVRAVSTGESYTTVPRVDPGGELLLSAKGWQKVERVFEIVDAIEAAGHDPCAAAPDYWRHVHNRLAAGLAPRTYSGDRHRAWALRRKFQP